MKILVFAKQVPEVDKVSFDPATNRINRENVPLSMNSFDRKAVEEAIRFKERIAAEVHVATMGPPQAKEILNDALKMGADRAYLITDRRFGGSDTLATSRILSALVKRIKPELVLMGKYSLDGETSQVPPEVAVFSDYAFKSSISRIELEQDGKHAIVEHEAEKGLFTFKIPLPAVFSVSEKINRARAIKPDAPDMSGKIQELDSVKLGIDFLGSEYSPTVVTGTSVLKSQRTVEMIPFDRDVFRKVYDIIREYRGSRNDHETVKASEPPVGSPMILGVALDDRRLGQEISSKISQLASLEPLRVAMFGNVDPEDCLGFIGHEYFYYPSESTEGFADALHDFIKEKKPKYVVFPSTVAGREIAGTIAARLQVGLTADCVDLEIKDGKLIQYKPAFGGGVIASIYSKTDPQMTTVRPGMFRILESSQKPVVYEIGFGGVGKYEALGSTPVSSEYMPLTGSDVIIGIGKGVKKREQVSLVLDLAGKINAAVGATRPLVDMNFVPRQQQIGLTGLSISPGVYIAIGVSGMANHVVGLRYCRKIIAVNSDPNAPIFGYSDYGIVADAQEFMQGLLDYLKGMT